VKRLEDGTIPTSSTRTETGRKSLKAASQLDEYAAFGSPSRRPEHVVPALRQTTNPTRAPSRSDRSHRLQALVIESKPSTVYARRETDFDRVEIVGFRAGRVAVRAFDDAG
jgi:hypothetical protein